MDENVINVAVTASIEQLQSGMQEGTSIVTRSTQQWKEAFDAATAAMQADIDALKLKIAQMQVQMEEAMRSTVSHSHEATGALAILGHEVGIKMDRHVRGFIANLPGVSTALNAAFTGVAIIGVIVLLVEVGKKVFEFIESLSKLSAAEQKYHDDVVKNANEELKIAERKIRAAYDLKIAQADDEIEKQRLKVQLATALVGLDAKHVEELEKEAVRLQGLVGLHQQRSKEAAQRSLDASQNIEGGDVGAGLSAMLEGEKAEAFQKAAKDAGKDLEAAADALKEAQAHMVTTVHETGSKALSQAVAVERAKVEAAKVTANAEASLAEKTAAFQYEQGKISLDEYTAAQKSAINKRFEADRDAVREEIAILSKSPLRNKDKLLVAQAQLTALEQKHKEDLLNVDRQRLSEETGIYLQGQESKAALAKQGSKERVQIETETFNHIASLYGKDSKIYQDALKRKQIAEKEYRKQHLEEAIKDGIAEIDDAEKVAMGKLQIARRQLDDEYQAGNINRAQYLAAVQGLLKAEMQARDAALKAKLQLLQRDPDTNVNEIRRIQAEMLLSYHKFLNDKDAAFEKSRKQEEAKWKQHMNAIGSAFSSTAKGLISGSQSISQSFMQLGQQILGTMIDSLSKILVKWIETNILGMASDDEAAAADEATQTEASTIDAAIVAAQSKAQIVADASTAAAGAYSATAVIPIVGPGLAPAAAATAKAAVLSMGVLERGGIVPADMLALVHKDEMVLPRPISQAVQSMTQNGGGGADGASLQNNFTVNALDSRSVAQFFRANARTITRAHKQQLRRYGVRT